MTADNRHYVQCGYWFTWCRFCTDGRCVLKAALDIMGLSIGVPDETKDFAR